MEKHHPYHECWSMEFPCPIMDVECGIKTLKDHGKPTGRSL
jgi:hypothetical protein